MNYMLANYYPSHVDNAPKQVLVHLTHRLTEFLRTKLFDTELIRKEPGFQFIQFELPEEFIPLVLFLSSPEVDSMAFAIRHMLDSCADGYAFSYPENHPMIELAVSLAQTNPLIWPFVRFYKMGGIDFCAEVSNMDGFVVDDLEMVEGFLLPG